MRSDRTQYCKSLSASGEWREHFIQGGEMDWPEPIDSRNAVRKAGSRIKADAATASDIDVLNRWRAAHGYIINTFQATLRTRTRFTRIPVAQRLKRASTIVDKLKQGRALDLSSMHDIAGIRIVFPKIEEMIAFRGQSHQSRAKHVLVNDLNKYDYLEQPKSSGYRGIHDVYRYVAGTESGAKWNGLLIEIQYRTLIQHAWATAVEMSDAMMKNRVKFSQGTPDSERFFQICSELLARTYENSTSCFPGASINELLEEWHTIEERSHIFSQLKSIYEQGSAENLQGFVLLAIKTDGSLQVFRQKNYRDAVTNLLQIESNHPEWDVVLASGDKDDSLRSAFRNYFRNSREFVGLMENAIAKYGLYM